jgi:hypothetical protein
MAEARATGRPAPRLSAEAVYLVESPEDRAALLAIGPQLADKRVRWHDSVRHRSFPVVEARAAGPQVIVKTPRATYRFRPLTLELYDARVRRRVAGAPRFGSTAEVQAHYLATPR